MEKFDRIGLLDHAWHIHAYLNTYIRSANATAAAVFALLGVVTGVILRLLPAVAHPLKTVLAVLGLALSLVAAIASLRVVVPRTKPREPRIGTVFWEHIRHYPDYESYRAKLDSTDPFEEVTRQNYELAWVTGKKYGALKFAIFLVLFICAYWSLVLTILY